MSELRIPSAYRLVQKSRIEEYALDGYVLEHRKTGARVCLLPCSDENKCFYIGFRTPPEDSTGVPHIMEHSVLCGSDKYPVKDPFVELLKSSLQTFLNAMTFPDKTVYPVASCNRKDLNNLMDIYLDAVFHPKVYSNENIFRQEGWRYELESPDAPLTLNGVVYNEMKGAYSSAEEMLSVKITGSLFPHTAYGVDSGGDPDVIPTLSYEEFCDFHRRYYHPSNSYIYLYGDLDMTERLEYLDREYLSHYERENIDSALTKEAPFENRQTVFAEYPLGAEEAEAGRTYLSRQWVTGDILDSLTDKAMGILDSVLLQAPGAPLRQAILDAGIGCDVIGGYTPWGLQTYFSVAAVDAEKEQAETFERVVTETLEKLAREGLNRKSLLAAINSTELRTRESDFGSEPKGLIYGIALLDSWLFDGEDVFAPLRFEKSFSYLREHLEDGYFEELIRRQLLQNPHGSLLVMEPKKGLAEQKAELLAEKLAARKASLSSEELQTLIDSCHALRAYQTAEDPPQALATIPRLGFEDLRKTVRPIKNREEILEGRKLYSRELPTVGISYMNLVFPLDPVAGEDLPWLGLLKACFGLVSTEHYGYRDLYDEITEHTGGFSLSLDCFSRVSGESYHPSAVFSMKALSGEMQRGMELAEEVFLRSDYSDAGRMHEILQEVLTDMRESFIEDGNSAAVLRASSYGSERSLIGEKISGIDFYRFVNALEADFDRRQPEIAEALSRVAGRLFQKEGLIVNLTTAENDGTASREAIAALLRKLPSCPEKCFSAPVPEVLNEGFMTSSAVNFVAVAGDYHSAGPYTGALRVLRSLLYSSYLWQNLRVLGGAYGFMTLFPFTGQSYLCSFRDPHIRRTMEVYEELPHYLETLEEDEKSILGYIISTIGGMDLPLTPSMQTMIDFRYAMTGVTEALLQKERDEVLSCTVEDLRALAPYIRAILDCRQLCTIGSAMKIREDGDIFRKQNTLLKEDV